ncbi:MAG: L-ascorbate metabolism protein UlaG (beta-lactamase superfamily), partial [Sphingobacteriales bacterium]
SSSFPDGTYGGNPAGFLITVGEKRLYYAGDTALMTDMKLFGDYYKPTLAILPIGDNFTMGAKDAALAAEMLNCKDVIGMHYDTFGYIKIDKKEAEKAFNAKDCNLILMEIGESKNF